MSSKNVNTKESKNIKNNIKADVKETKNKKPEHKKFEEPELEPEAESESESESESGSESGSESESESEPEKSKPKNEEHKKSEQVSTSSVKKAEDNDSENSESSDDSEDDDVKVVSTSKEKKPKKLWKEVVIEWDKLNHDQKENEAKHKEFLEAIHKNEKIRNELERQRNRLYSILLKSHDEEIKRISKEKPNRKKNKNRNNGILKETPVPHKLIKYLGLEDGVQMSRPQLTHLLNDKFKEDGLKEGQITRLDKKTAIALGKDIGRVIEFTGFQQFLKEIYDEDISRTKLIN